MSLSPIAESLSRAELLGGLTAETLEELASSARRRRYRKGEVIFHEGDDGDTLYVLESGRVKVVTDAASGSEALFTILGPGECFGELSMIDSAPRSATVEALEPVESILLRRPDFLAVLHASPDTTERLLVTMSAMIRRITQMVGDLAFLDVEGRLAKKLLQMADEYGHPVKDGIEIDLPINHEEIAAMIGTTRPTVNRLLNLFKDQGAIRYERGRITILDANRLLRRIV